MQWGVKPRVLDRWLNAGGDDILALKQNQGHLYLYVDLRKDDLTLSPAPDAYSDGDLDESPNNRERSRTYLYPLCPDTFWVGLHRRKRNAKGFMQKSILDPFLPQHRHQSDRPTGHPGSGIDRIP